LNVFGVVAEENGNINIKYGPGSCDLQLFFFQLQVEDPQPSRSILETPPHSHWIFLQLGRHQAFRVIRSRSVQSDTTDSYFARTMANPRQRRKSRSSSHKAVSHSRHAKRNLKKTPREFPPHFSQVECWLMVSVT